MPNQQHPSDSVNPESKDGGYDERAGQWNPAVSYRQIRCRAGICPRNRVPSRRWRPRCNPRSEGHRPPCWRRSYWPRGIGRTAGRLLDQWIEGAHSDPQPGSRLKHPQASDLHVVVALIPSAWRATELRHAPGPREVNARTGQLTALGSASARRRAMHTSMNFGSVTRARRNHRRTMLIDKPAGAARFEAGVLAGNAPMPQPVVDGVGPRCRCAQSRRCTMADSIAAPHVSAKQAFTLVGKWTSDRVGRVALQLTQDIGANNCLATMQILRFEHGRCTV
jgi:hypothetical protein